MPNYLLIESLIASGNTQSDTTTTTLEIESTEELPEIEAEFANKLCEE